MQWEQALLARRSPDGVPVRSHAERDTQKMNDSSHSEILPSQIHCDCVDSKAPADI